MFGVNICVRCFGMVMSFCMAIVLMTKFDIPCDGWKVFLCVIAMLPAGIDFTLGELVPSYPRSNMLRFLTGSIFGVGIGISVSWCYTEGCWMPTALFVAFAFIMQMVISLLFYMCGHLDEYALKYENAVS